MNTKKEKFIEEAMKRYEVVSFEEVSSRNNYASYPQWEKHIQQNSVMSKRYFHPKFISENTQEFIWDRVWEGAVIPRIVYDKTVKDVYYIPNEYPNEYLNRILDEIERTVNEELREIGIQYDGYPKMMYVSDEEDIKSAHKAVVLFKYKDLYYTCAPEHKTIHDTLDTRSSKAEIYPFLHGWELDELPPLALTKQQIEKKYGKKVNIVDDKPSVSLENN